MLVAVGVADGMTLFKQGFALVHCWPGNVEIDGVGVMVAAAVTVAKGRFPFLFFEFCSRILLSSSGDFGFPPRQYLGSEQPDPPPISP